MEPGPGQPWHRARRESVTRSHATSRQRRVWPSSQRPRPGEAGEGATGQSPPRALISGPVHELWELPEGRPAQGETPLQDTGDPEGTPHGSVVPPPGQECEQQGQRGDAVFFPPAWGFQTSPGSRQDRQPRVRAKTVPSTRGQGAAPSLPGHLPERCWQGAGGVLRMPWGRGTREVRGRPGPFNALSYARVTLGAAGSRRAESRAEQSGGRPPPRRHQLLPPRLLNAAPTGQGQDKLHPRLLPGAGPLGPGAPSSALRRGSHAGRPDSSMYKRRTQDRPPRADGRGTVCG